MRRIIAFLIALVFCCPVPALSRANFDVGDLAVVSLPFGNDLYIAGGKVVVTETVAGDLLAAGGSLIINGPVGADLQAVGGNLIVNGPVGDDLRVAGGDITLVSRVGGDVVIYGGSVTIPDGVVVEGDVIIRSGALHLGGTIMGDLRVDASVVDFSGTVKGNAKFIGDEKIRLSGRVEGQSLAAAPELVLGPGAGFGEDIVYWRKDGQMDFGRAPIGGQARFSPELKRDETHGQHPFKERTVRRGLEAVFSLFFLGTLLSGTLVIALCVALFPKVFREAGEILHETFLKSLGVGILTYLLLPVSAVIAMVTLVGIPVGLVLAVLFGLSVIFGRVITAIVFAAWIERRRADQWSSGRLMIAGMGVYTVIKLVGLVPFLGWVLVLLTTLTGYGALVAVLVSRRQEEY